MEITPVSIAMFFLYTLVALLAALVARIGVGTMGEKAKNQAVAAVTTMVADAVKDRAEISDKLLDVTSKLHDEREHRARLEGKVETLMNQTATEKSRADSAYETLAKQTSQIDKLSSEVDKLTNEIGIIRERLATVEAEKRVLEAEKNRLVNDLTTQGDEYRKLMETIQARIDKAVADVREELRLDYEKRIAKLEKEISDRDIEIADLKAKLKESESDEKSTAPSSATAADTELDSTITSTGSNGSSSTDSGSADSPDSGSSSDGSPSA